MSVCSCQTSEWPVFITEAGKIFKLTLLDQWLQYESFHEKNLNYASYS